MTKEQWNKLFKIMTFCPVCGSELKILGTSRSEFKSCPAEHGTMTVVGRKAGQRVGMFLEVFEE